MNNILTVLKLGIAAQLQKQGSNLEEFEKSLSKLNQADGAIKVAEALLSISDLEKHASFLDMLGGGLKAISEMGLTSAMLVGSVGGAGAYGLKNYMDGQDKDGHKREEEIHRIKMLNERLQQDYGIAPQQRHQHNG